LENRKPLDSRAVGLMLLLCVVWGLQQSVLKLAAPDMAPVMQIALRSGIAAVLVGLFMLWRREGLALGNGTWRPGLVVGFLFALEFLLVGQGIRWTSASHVVVFLYTAPVFVALGLHFLLPAERLNTIQWLGIALAFAGMVLTFFGRSAVAVPAEVGANLAVNPLWGDALALMGGMAWAATTVVVRCSSLSRASASQTLMYQLVAAFVLLLLAAVVLGQTHINPTPLAWGALAFQALVVSFASFLVWFWLLRHYLASQLGVFSFVTPLFGVAFGILLLNEPLEASFVAGAVLVLGGVVLVSNHQWFRTLWARYQ
jgi:drug/metabolite transporter (DMT)-like permease